MLEGHLGDFRLLDVLQLLNAAAKTGSLVLEAESASARVEVDHGRVREVVVPGGFPAPPPGASAEAGDRSDEARVDDLVDLLLWDAGRFRFEGPAVQPPAPESAPEDPLLDAARRRLQTWPQLAERVGGQRAVLALAAPHRREPVTLTADRWRLVSLVDGRRSVGELAGLSGRGAYSTHRALADLLDEGLLAPVAVLDAAPSVPVTVPDPAPSGPVTAEPETTLTIPPSPPLVYEGQGPRGLRTRVRTDRVQGTQHEVDQSLLQRLIHGVENL